MPNFGKMHINPFITFRRSTKVFIAIKTLNENWVKTASFGGFEPSLNINILHKFFFLKM